MTLIQHRGSKPEFDSSVYIAPTAVLVGKVRIGSGTRILYGAVLDSEASAVEIGRGTVILENAVLRATASGDVDHPVIVGDNVFISPHATVLGATIESGAFISTGVTVLHGAVVHSGAVIGVGAFIHGGTVVPENFFVPPNTVAVGNPLRLFGPPDKEELVKTIETIKFPKLAYAIETDLFSQAVVAATEVRAKEFESHFNDIVLEVVKQ